MRFRLFVIVAMCGHSFAPRIYAGGPVIEKLGTIDCDMVEVTPIVFGDKLYRYEYVRDRYKPNTTGKSYSRFIDVATGKATPSFAGGFHLGSAFVDDGAVHVFAVPKWGAESIHQFTSTDLVTWTDQVALNLPGWGIYNTDVCKTPGGYVMAFEIGEPPEEAGKRFTIRFAKSADLKRWTLTERACVYTRDKYSACPDIEYLDGFYYMFYLEAYPGPQYAPCLVRSKDLIHWEASGFNPVMRHSPEDKRIANPRLTAPQRKHIEAARNLNNSDIGLCEFQGETVIYYSWGNQQGIEFLAEARYAGSVPDLLRGFFPER